MLIPKLANIIESKRLKTYKMTRVTLFEAYFGQKPNADLTNIVTSPSINNLSYHKLKN